MFLVQYEEYNQPSKSTSCSDNACPSMLVDSRGGQIKLRISSDAIFIFNPELRFERMF